MRKGSAADAERDASRHAVGGKARVYFFLFIFIHQFKLYFFTFFVSRTVDSTRPDQHFFSLWKRPRRPPRVRFKRPGGAISEMFYGTPRRAFTPFLTVVSYANISWHAVNLRSFTSMTCRPRLPSKYQHQTLFLT